ncbi:MAG: alpha/beta fold hydrolase [Candidatus Ozemobacteraceae bacterium]
MHYADEGPRDGEPLVMVHGNPSWSFLFRRLIDAFKTTHRTIAVDHIGCGLSDKPGDDAYPYRLENRIEDLERLIDSLHLKQPITLVLHDWGGAIGMGFAVRRPDRIKRIIALNTGAFRLPEAKTFPWPLWFFRNLGLGEFANRAFNAFSSIATWAAVAKTMPEDVKRGFTGPYNSWENRIATIRFVQDIPLIESDPSWKEIRKIEEGFAEFRETPALLCFGRKDWVFDRHFFAEWRRRLPRAEAHSFSDASHYVLEDAHERVIPLIREFLVRNPLPAKT